MKSLNRILYVSPYYLQTGFVSWKFLKWAGIGLLQKCMQCKNVQIGLGKSEREWTALFYINWTNKLWKNENIYYRHSEHSVCSFTMPGKNRSPWWNHFQIVDGDFRVVQCILCNKMVRRGKAGCSSKETSNSGMATHMRSKHRDQATFTKSWNVQKCSWFCPLFKSLHRGLWIQDVFLISEIKCRKCLQENQNFCQSKFLIPAGYSLLLVTWFHFPVQNLWIGITDWRESQSKD